MAPRRAGTPPADPLASFSAPTRAWFERAFAGPTPAQQAAWPAIASGADVLVQAPTGSGKTLTAFLFAIDRLLREGTAHADDESALSFW